MLGYDGYVTMMFVVPYDYYDYYYYYYYYYYSLDMSLFLLVLLYPKPAAVRLVSRDIVMTTTQSYSSFSHLPPPSHTPPLSLGMSPEA